MKCKNFEFRLLEQQAKGPTMTTQHDERAELHSFGCNAEAKYGSKPCERWCGRRECPTSDPVKQHAEEYFAQCLGREVGEGYDYNSKEANTAYAMRSGFIEGFRKAAALLAADAQAGGEAALWVSPGQFENLKADHDDESGTYLPVRHTSRGKFTMPLYTRHQPQSVAQGWKLPYVDRSEAVNLARNYLYSSLCKPLTQAGAEILAHAVLKMDAAMLSASPAAPAAAQVAQPLTDEQAEQLRKQWMYGEDHRYSPFVAGLRAAEAAHGIGKDQV